jgi:superfamily II DNA or RNA helicase
MITRYGTLTKSTTEIKKELTVRADDTVYGIKSPLFKVFKEGTGGQIYAPRYFAPNVSDSRTEPKGIQVSFRGELRPHQQEAFSKFFETPSGGVLSMPCGFGKTCTSLSIASRVGLRVIIIVHKEFLANQWRENIQRFCPGATIGLIQGATENVECDFVIAMIQTLCSREHPPHLFDSFGLVIVDECHHIGAPAFSQCMFKMCPKYTLGLSATPERKDGLTRVLHWFLGPTFYNLERHEMDHVKVHKINFKHHSYGSLPLNKLGKVSLVDMVTTLVDIPERNQVIYDIVENNPGRVILILTDRREHAKSMHMNISGSALYIGGMKEDQLKESSKSNCIIGTFSLAHEGLDIPRLDTIILATPHSDVKQAVGRIMRGSQHPIIYDVVDQWGPLFAMWNKRSKMYDAMGFVNDTCMINLE